MNYIRKIITFIIIILFSTKFWNYYVFYKRHFFDKTLHSNYLNHKEVKIRVLSYNLFLLPDPFFCNILDHAHSDYKNSRCDIISKKLYNYDIIFFQEVHPYLNFRCDHLVNQAKQQGLLYSYYTLGPSFFSKYVLSNGLLILSRFPIISKDYLSFSQSQSYDSLMEKGVIYSKIQINKHLPPIHLFNTHLQASYSKKMIWEETRHSQLRELKKFMHSKCNLSKDQIICGGDFNIDYYNKEYIDLKKNLNPLQDSFYLNSNLSLKHTIIIPYDKQDEEMTNVCIICKKCNLKNVDRFEKQKLDYIFFSKTRHLKLIQSTILPFVLKDQKLPFRCLSDHHAYYSLFILNK